MYEGREIKMKHPVSREVIEGIVAAADCNIGITVVDAQDPEIILFCTTKGRPLFEEEYVMFEECLKENKPYDSYKALAKQMGVPLSLIELFSSMATLAEFEKPNPNTGASQETLHNRCAFNQRRQ